MVVGIAVGLDVAQKFQLVESLVEEVLVVLDYLETCKLLVL